MEFRHNALAKLQSPEELDLPVRFARPQGRLALAVCVVVLAAAGVWAVTGRVAEKLTAAGVLTRVEGAYVLQSPLAGQVVRIRAQAGDWLQAGAALLDVRTAAGVRPVTTVAAGRVVALTTAIGAVIGAGAGVATVERATRPDEPLVAMLYVSGSGAASVPQGAAVDVDVPSVPGRYGVLRGHVTAVGRAPLGARQIAAFLGDDKLAEALTAKGPAVPVVVRLDPAAANRSGFRWSKGGGPPYALTPMTPVGASLRLSAQRPLDWLLP